MRIRDDLMHLGIVQRGAGDAAGGRGRAPQRAT